MPNLVACTRKSSIIINILAFCVLSCSLYMANAFDLIKGMDNVTTISTGGGFIRIGKFGVQDDYDDLLPIYDMNVSGKLLACTTLGRDLLAINISNPASPILVMENKDHYHWHRPFQIAGDYLYAGNLLMDGDTWWDDFMIYDISNPQSIIEHQLDNDFLNTLSFLIHNKIGYFYGENRMLYVVDMHDPHHIITNGSLNASIPSPTNNVVTHIRFFKGLLYVCHKYYGIQLFDVRNPDHPAHAGDIVLETGFMGQYAADVASDGNLAYIIYSQRDASNSDIIRGIMHIYDIADPTSPRLINTMIIPNEPSNIQIDHDRLYLYDRNGIALYVLKDPTSPGFVSRMNYPGSNTYGNIHVENGNIYLPADTWIYTYRYVPPTPISNVSRKGYIPDRLRAGGQPYTDRVYQYIDPIPAKIAGQTILMTRNDDKISTGSYLFSFDVNTPVTVYVGVDERNTAPPSWLGDWIRTGERLVTTDPGGGGRLLYQKHFPKGRISLGGNLGPNSPAKMAMYTIAVVPDRNSVADWLEYQ